MLEPGLAAPTRNPGYRAMFAAGRLTLGVFFPIESFVGDRPEMRGQAELARRAEAGGFSALWFRDVPLRDPGFGDVGQVFDPWVFLGYIAAQTSTIALATGAIVLPLRHPIHTAKAAASVDQLSRGRLVLGVATGDRAVEFAAFGRDAEARGDDFREHLCELRRLLTERCPRLATRYGRIEQADLVPKPVAAGIPTLVVGNSRQTMSWIAKNSDGWVTYPRPLEAQERVAQEWRALAAAEAPGRFMPFAQSLYVDLAADPRAPMTPIHLGWRVGREGLLAILRRLRASGVHHVALNLKYGRRAAAEVLDELIEHVVPHLEYGLHSGSAHVQGRAVQG